MYVFVLSNDQSLFKCQVPTISKSTFYRHVRTYINHQILLTWRQQQAELIQDARSRGNVVQLGDCRSDSPGHCAKYGTYTMIDTHSGKVLASEMIQVSIHVMELYYIQSYIIRSPRP